MEENKCAQCLEQVTNVVKAFVRTFVRALAVGVKAIAYFIVWVLEKMGECMCCFTKKFTEHLFFWFFINGLMFILLLMILYEFIMYETANVYFWEQTPLYFLRGATVNIDVVPYATLAPAPPLTVYMTHSPTFLPSTWSPSFPPSSVPSLNPTFLPSFTPSSVPSYRPSFTPSYTPSLRPTIM